MNPVIHIFKLLLTNPCLTSAQLAEQLSCSRRTILNHMPEVRSLAESRGLALCSRRGGGYSLCGEEEVMARLVNDYRFVATGSSGQERIYAVLFRLLTNDAPLYMTELEHTFHVSRSSIHLTLNKTTEWLKNYEILLKRDRQTGISCSYGEKRRRLALSYWCKEVGELLTSRASLSEGPIYRLLSRNLLSIDKYPEPEAIHRMLSRLKLSLNLVISHAEYDQLTRLLQISIIRQRGGHYCKIPSRLIDISESEDISKQMQLVADVVAQEFSLYLPHSEVIYLYTLMMSVSKVSRAHAMHFIKDIHISPRCKEKLLDKLDRSLRLQPAARSQLIHQLTYELKRELFFGVYDKNPTGVTYYSSMAGSFTIVRDFACSLGDIILQHYDIKFYDRFLYTLCLLIRRAVEVSKTSLSILVVHDCDELELAILKDTITHNFYKFAEWSYLSSSDTDFLCSAKSYDLLLTTNHELAILALFEPQPIVSISKILNTEEIIRLSQRLHILYQAKNIRDIVIGDVSDIERIIGCRIQ